MADELNDSDLSENEERHSILLDALAELDNTRRVRAPTRREVSTVVSEFHLPKEQTNKRFLVNVNELTAAFQNKTATHNEIRKRVKSVMSKAKTLPKPLATPEAEKIKRTIGYENVKRELKKWNAVVERNRAADHLSFPLKQGHVSLQSSHQFLKKFKPTTPLEIEMAKVLGTETQDAEDDDDEVNKNLEFPLTFEEMMEKKKELARIRAKLSYQEAKAHRQSKIKSKKYHRIMKREKVKQQLKEFEQLQKTDPEAALKKLEELDKNRAEERASLRHKSTGKWARNVAVRAKYDTESRKVLAEQLKLSRDLTAKVKNVHSDEELSDHEIHEENPKDIFTNSDNPWALKVSSEVSNFVSTCKKYWENKNKENKNDSTAEHRPSPKAGGNVANILSDNSGKSSPSIVESAAGRPASDDVDLENSHNNENNAKGKELVKNHTPTLTNGRCTKSKNGSLFTSDIVYNGKNEKSEKRSNKTADHTAITQKKLPKNKKTEKPKPVAPLRTGKMLKCKVRSTSGLWKVSEVTDQKVKKKGKLKIVKDIDDLFDDLYEKLASKTSEKLKEVREKYSKNKEVKDKVDSDSNDDDDDLAFKNPSTLRPEVDEEMAETTGKEPKGSNEEIPVKTAAFNFEVSEDNSPPPEIDPNKFIQVKPKKLDTKLPDNLTGDENLYMDDEKEATQQMNVVEAFGDDDVVEEFEDMKKKEEENTKLDVPNALPGWGSWGGTDIKPDERKTKRNMVSVPKLPPRKDRNKKDIIIRDKTNMKILQHLVKDIPHPFKSVGAFESNLRHPLGREWIPETAHRKFIKKPVETLMGSIIEPMDVSELLRLKKEEKSLYKGKKKQKR